jgi:hypothetical protein
MQATPPDSGRNYDNGFLQNFFQRVKNLQRPILLPILFVFVLTMGIGYWLGSHLVVNKSGIVTEFSRTTTESRVITLLEVSDFSIDEPELISIWVIHLAPGDIPRLGFTPVAAISMLDDPNSNLLTQFSLDENGAPSQIFLQSLRKINVHSDGYVVLDQVAISAFINWFSIKDDGEGFGLENHSMAEYGRILRGMCQAFPGLAVNEVKEIPWSKISDGHFKSSLQFDQVMSDIRFLTATVSPRCEMVPLP